MVLTVTKIVNDLERIGDEVKKIAYKAAQTRGSDRLAQVRYYDVARAPASTRWRCCRLALDAFARLDAVAAAEVIGRDDGHRRGVPAILRQLISYMMEDPRTITPALEIVFIAKSIERIGDHAKNIAEAVVQVVKGKDVRHASAEQIRAEVARAMSPRRRARRRFMMPTILVVEDEPAILELLRVNLVDAGYEVTRRADAETAQRSLKRDRCRISCCSTGCCPGNRGWRSRRQLRGDARTRELPIIMVTARTDEADKVAGLEAWVDDYVTKPFSPRELKARIKAVLRRRAPEAAQETLEVGPAEARPGDAPRDASAGQAGRRRSDRIPAAALLPRASRARAHARATARQVWGDHVYIEERTVDVHIRRLRAGARAVRRRRADRDGARQRLPARRVTPAGSPSPRAR